MTSEKNKYMDNCFVDRYHLAAKVGRLTPVSAQISLLSRALHMKVMNRRFANFTGWGQIFGNKALVSWGIFAAARHPAMLRMLQVRRRSQAQLVVPQ